MPATRQQLFTIFDVSPVAVATSTPEVGFDFDHLTLFIEFTLGSLTNITIEPQFSYDGVTWMDVYDATMTQITYTPTASMTRAFVLGANNSNSRLQPLPFCVPLWRFDLAITGSPTGSSLKLQGQPFVVGNIKD